MNRDNFKYYIELTKPGITTMVLVTTTIGFLLADLYNIKIINLFITLIGTYLTCAGSAALNHYLEKDLDCLMNRTSKRPLPLKKISSVNALNFGLILIIIGVVILFFFINLLTAFLALLTAFLYVLVYTPLKKISWTNTIIGAIPGALPPLGGWTAQSGQIGFGGLVLFLILFIWQHPHFYSIAWMYKDDYKKAGLIMLPSVNNGESLLFKQVLWFSILLVPVTILLFYTSSLTIFYLIGSVLLSFYMLWYGVGFYNKKDNISAKKLLKASIFYLPLWFLLVFIDITLKFI